MKRYLFLLTILFTLPPSLSLAQDGANAEPGKSYASVEERRLLVALQQERNDLALEKEELSKQKNELKRLESEVDKKLDQLKRLRQQVEQLLVEKDVKEIQRVKDLSKMYEKMSPEKAARIFGTIEQELAISIMENMKTKSAARILNNMDRERAAILTTGFSSLEK